MAVSYNDIKDVMNYGNTSVVNWNGVEITVRRIISVSELIAIVNSVASSAFSGETGAYSPVSVDFTERFAVLGLYTDIQMPEDINERYELCYAPGLYISVVEAIDPAQYEHLVRSVAREVEYLKQAGINEMNARINKLMNMIESFGNSMKSVMEQISPEDMQKLTEAMAKFGFDENKIVQAYLDASKEQENG